MPMPEWMRDPKFASDPAWSLARAWYVGEVCEKIMMMADEQGLVKASKVVDLLLDPDVDTRSSTTLRPAWSPSRL